MSASFVQWKVDRQRCHVPRTLLPVAIEQPAASRDVVLEWVIEHTESVDEIYLSMWIIDRCVHPTHLALCECAVIMAHKMLGVEVARMSLLTLARKHGFKSTVRQLYLNELYIAEQLSWKFTNVIITDHIISLLRMLRGGGHAKRYMKQCILSLLCKFPRTPLPEFAVAVCLEALWLSGQRSDAKRAAVWLSRVSGVTLDIARCYVMAQHVEI